MTVCAFHVTFASLRLCRISDVTLMVQILNHPNTGENSKSETQSRFRWVFVQYLSSFDVPVEYVAMWFINSYIIAFEILFDRRSFSG